MSLRTYLLMQWANCNPPQPPNNLAIVLVTINSITLSWSQPVVVPPVTTDHYIVSWGSSSGNYNLGMATVAGGTFSYTITGLTTNQTIYIVVQAIGTDGCPSANSAQISSTTEPGNGMLLNIAAYDALSDSSATLQNGTILDQAAPSRVYSAPNTAIISAAGTGFIDPVADYHTNAGSDPTNVRRIQTSDATLNMVANQIFSACAWVKLNAKTASNPIVDNWGASGFYLGQSGGNNWTFGVHKGDNTTAFIDNGATSTGAWVFLVGGWDGTNIWISVNGGAKVTSAVANTHAFTDNFTIGSYPGVGGSIPCDGLIGGVGLWLRNLSPTDITFLYNSGSGRPFSDFST